MGRRVAILCINPWERPGSYQPFSYAAYRIQAALHGWRGVDDVRVFEGYGWSVDRFVAEIEAFDPDVVGASTYVWSLRIFADVLAKLRANRPSRRLILGGPSARPAMLDLPPYRGAARSIDALVLGEGEEVIREIVDRYDEGPDALTGIPGLALPRHGLWRHTEPRGPIQNLDALPSPFQLGIAPSSVSAHFETFRGCPLSCTFCEWGGANNGSYFSKEYLVRELTAFREIKALNVYQVDAGLNLNSRAFKNLYAAEAEVGFIKEVGLTCEVYPSLLKEDQIEFLQMTRARIGIGLQSYNLDVLKTVERPFDPNRFERCIGDLTRHCHTTADIILGLPGDNPKSFRETMRRALDLPCNLRVYHCLVLPDALMTRGKPEWQIDFDPHTFQLRSCVGWTEAELLREHEFLSLEAERRRGTSCIQPLGAPVASVKEFGDGYSGATSTYWYFPLQDMSRFHRAGEPMDQPVVRPRVSLADEGRAAARIAEATRGSWRYESVRARGEGIVAAFQTAGGTMQIDIQLAGPGVRSFRVINDVAFSYRLDGAPRLSEAAIRQLEQVIAELSREVRRV